MKDRNAYSKDDDIRDLYYQLREEIVLSPKYRSGAYLLYDCTDEHFVCADEVSFKLCQKYRAQELAAKAENLSCGAIKKYPQPKACHRALYKYIEKVVSKDFCKNTSNFLKKF